MPVALKITDNNKKNKLSKRITSSKNSNYCEK